MIDQDKLMTAEELLALPEGDKRYELVRGVIVEMTPVNGQHGNLPLRLGHFLLMFDPEEKLGLLTTETGYILFRQPDVVRSPDLAFISAARLGDAPLNKFIPVAPDLAVEIVSPNDTAREIRAKVWEYLEAGTKLVWVIYPEEQTVDVYRNRRESKPLTIEDSLDGEDVLPGFTLSLRNLFGKLTKD